MTERDIDWPGVAIAWKQATPTSWVGKFEGSVFSVEEHDGLWKWAIEPDDAGVRLKGRWKSAHEPAGAATVRLAGTAANAHLAMVAAGERFFAWRRTN